MTKIYFIIIIFIFSVIMQKPCFAQIRGQQLTVYKGSFPLNGRITLDSLIRYVHRLSGMRFSFNSTKVKGSTEINFQKKDYSFPELLERIKKTTSIYYTFYNGYVIFQDNPPRQKSFSVTQKNKNINPAPRKEIMLYSQNNIAGKLKKMKIKNEIKKISGNDEPVIKAAVGKQQTSQIDSANNNTYWQLQNIDSSLQKSKNSSNNIPKNNEVIVDSTSNSMDTAFKNIPASNTADKPGSNSENEIGNNLHFGLQWNITLPLQGTNNYFTGTNGKSQPYYLLIPGVWVSRFFNREQEIMLQTTPTHQYFTGNKTLDTSIVGGLPGDLSGVIISTNLSKTISVATGLQYNYYINAKWEIGAGIFYNWQYNALLNKQVINRFDGSVISDSLYGIVRSSADWQYLSSSFITAKLEFAYRFNKFQAGCSVLVPFSSLSSNKDNSIRPINGQLFFRWRII